MGKIWVSCKVRGWAPGFAFLENFLIGFLRVKIQR